MFIAIALSVYTNKLDFHMTQAFNYIRIIIILLKTVSMRHPVHGLQVLHVVNLCAFIWCASIDGIEQGASIQYLWSKYL